MHAVACGSGTTNLASRLLNTNFENSVLRVVRAARRRIRWKIFAHAVVRRLLALLLLALCIASAARWLTWPWRGAGDLRLWVVLAGMTVFSASISAFARRISLRQTAALLDRRGETRDRFSTALGFAESTGTFQRLAAEECCAYLARHPLKLQEIVPLHLPKATPYLLVPMAALAMLLWDQKSAERERRDLAADAHAETAAKVRELEQLATATEATASPDLSPAAREKIAAQLRQSAAELRASNQGAEAASQAALRELSRLEELLRGLEKPPAQMLPAELHALAEALAAKAATQKSGAALAAGNLQEAAETLEESADSEAAKSQAEKVLRDVLQRLAEQRERSNALQQLAETARQNEGASAVRQLAKMLRQMAAQQSRTAGQGGSPQAGSLQQLLVALQNLKFGDGAPASSLVPQPGPGAAGALGMESSGELKAEQGSASDPSQTAGRVGSDRDHGTTESALGKNPVTLADATRSEGLKGQPGAGETLSQLLPATGDSSGARRRYKELYDALAPAAAEAITQEDIPLGSRFLIQRYFKSIRPQE